MNDLASKYNKLFPDKYSSDLINNSFIIFNADILLNLLYIHNDVSKEKFFKLLYKLKYEKKLYLTNQIAQDFLKNRFKNELDNTYNKIIELFNSIVYNPLDKISLEKIYKEGEFRYKNEIPPGYKYNKLYNKCKYHDLIIWKELLLLSKEHNKDILFISDQLKEDWIEKYNGKIYAREELFNEFYKETKHNFYILSSKKFFYTFSEKYSINLYEMVDKINKINEKKSNNFNKNNRSIHINVLHYKHSKDDELKKHLDNFLKKINNIQDIQFENVSISSIVKNEKNDIINRLTETFCIKNDDLEILKTDIDTENLDKTLNSLNVDIKRIELVIQFLYLRTDNISKLKPIIDVLDNDLESRKQLYDLLYKEYNKSYNYLKM